MLNPPIPSLIIGLGGSGAATVAHVKEQLLDIYNKELPKTVGLLVYDTALDPLAQFKRPVKFDPQEYGHLGGEARELAEAVVADRSGRFDHIGSWLQATDFLQTLPANVWNLNYGAGMFRQLGRLALFVDAAAPNLSLLYSRINGIISTMRHVLPAEESLFVFVVGSLAGGTGAGLFLDVAHLLRNIAASNEVKVQLRGFFYLPEAFAATIAASERSNARPRAFAALRELSRFMLHESFDLGYPIYYHDSSSTGQRDIWRARLKKKLYDLVYLIDGQTLSAYPMEKGATASVADAILAFIDSKAGPYQTQYMTNQPSNIRDKQKTEGRVPYVGSLGTYTIILPIQKIMEVWAHRLGKLVMDTLLTPKKIDPSTHLPLQLANDQNEERTDETSEAVQTLFEDRNPIVEVQTNQRVYPTALWPQLYRWYKQRIENETGAARQLAGNDAEWWMNIIEPAATETSPEAARVLRMIDGLMAKTISSEIQSSHEVKLDPRGDYQRIVGETKKFFDTHLGSIRSQGEREGGTFNQALTDLVQWQVDRFRQAFELYTLNELNGKDRVDAAKARKGKLGWTLALYVEIEGVLNNVLLLLTRARGEARAGSTTTQREETLREYDEAVQAIARVAKEGNRRNAEKAQQSFFEAADRALDLYRAEFARDSVEEVVRQMANYVHSAIEQIKGWVEILALHHEGLYALVHRGETDVIKNLRDAEEFPSRAYIRDEAWEEGRYDSYAADALNNALSGICWEAHQDTDTKGKPRLRILLTMDGKPLLDENRGDWPRKNNQTLMGFCRSIFAAAYEQESVLDYLTQYGYAGKPTELADLLFQKSGALLMYNTNFAKSVVTKLYLLVDQQRAQAESAAFVGDVVKTLRKHAGTSTSAQNAVDVQNSDDPFRLTLVSMAEMLPLPEITAYKSAETPYMESATSLRPQLHTFPAEVRAVQYEDLLPKLNQHRRMLRGRVVVLLEDIKRFKDFLVLMAHRIITEDRDYMDAKQSNFVYFLVTPSREEPDNPEVVDDWWLTKPSPDPSLLDAMTTYIFREEDYGKIEHIANYRSPIDYRHVEEHLLNVRQYDTDERLDAGVENIGLYKPEMKRWLAKYQPGTPHFNALARSIVEYDVLSEFRDWLKDTELPRVGRLQEEVQKPKPGGQAVDRAALEAADDLYDLFSVAILVVQEMMDSKLKDAQKVADERR